MTDTKSKKRDKRKAQKPNEKKRDWVSIILVLVVLVGIGLIVYPTISNYIAEKKQSEAISLYSVTVSSMDEELCEQMLVEAQEYNSYLALKSNQWEISDSDSEWYNSLLDVSDNGVMGIIEIPSINVSIPIYHGTSDSVLQVGVGHLEGTSLPIGGTGTHAVLSGHRGLVSAKLFSDLDELELGDRFYITVLGETLVYEVDQILIVDPNDTSAIGIDPDEDYVTLLTCTPYGINTHRLLVRGHRIDEEATYSAVGEATIVSRVLVAPFVALLILLIILVVVFIYTRKNQKNKTDVT